MTTRSVPPQKMVRAAIAVASTYPRCQKSHRGVAIWDDGGLLALARNSPPKPFRCDGSDACRSACNRVAVHAEERALLTATTLRSAGCGIQGASLLHIKVRDGEPVVSGPPSCWQCSRMMVEAGIARVWLLQSDGWRSWSAEAFHFDTLVHCGLPRGLVHRPPKETTD